MRTLVEPPAGCDSEQGRIVGVGGLHEDAGGAEAHCRRKHKTVLRDQEHRFVALRLIQDVTQMVTASCDAGNRISDCRRFSMKGAWCVPGGRPHRTSTTTAARSGHWRRCEIERGEEEGAVVRRSRCVAPGARRQADVTCGSATQVAVHDSLSKARRRGRIAAGSRNSSRVGLIADTSFEP